MDDVITGQNLGSFRMMYTNRTKMDGNFLDNVFNRTKISFRAMFINRKKRIKSLGWCLTGQKRMKLENNIFFCVILSLNYMNKGNFCKIFPTTQPLVFIRYSIFRKPTLFDQWNRFLLNIYSFHLKIQFTK